jgi:hypothetical protein
MKYKNIVYWLLGIFIFIGWSDLVWGESIQKDPVSKVEEEQRKKKKRTKVVKKKTVIVKKKVVTTTPVKKKVKKRVETVKGSSRVQVPPTPVPIPNFRYISKADFISGKYKRLTIPYVEGGQTKWGIANYNSGRYIIIRNLGINADGATYDYWKSK